VPTVVLDLTYRKVQLILPEQAYLVLPSVSGFSEASSGIENETEAREGKSDGRYNFHSELFLKTKRLSVSDVQ
jgi:hypothetical protein